jgi:ATP-dependent Clp protease ATP-binding subunit ClpB
MTASRDTAPAGRTAPARLAGWPAFIREMEATLAVHAQYVLWGNLHDSFLVPGTGDAPPRLLALLDVLWETLRSSGYPCLIVYDQVDGLRVHPSREVDGGVATEAAAKLIGNAAEGGADSGAGPGRGAGRGPRPGGQGRATPSLEGLARTLTAVARPATQVRAAFVIDYASRIASRTGSGAADPELAEKDFFVACEKLSRTATPVWVTGERAQPLYNPIIWLAERPGDLPSWLTAGNDMIREISVPRPHLGDRLETARLLSRAFGVTGAPTPDEPEPETEPAPEAVAEVCEAFALAAEGLSLQAMIEVTRLARDRGLDFAELPDAVRTYKLGVLDNPWRREHLRRRIAAGERDVPERVVGQPQAVTKTLDILKRAALGLSGAQATGSSGRPRGVLFFAGPTGVGKTELAKAITRLVFGDESAYLRFDMSEFSAEHAGDRLIGSPPGYVGHEAGGELTNAVRQDPFRVILFDEIEKAHPRILDKFLQILEDGRLTDGRGTTVHFSESILVFTSNLGTYVDDGSGRRVRNVIPGMPYEEIERRLRAAISDHFTTVLGRPELLNRLGDNIVIFDFIGPDAARQIFALQLANICRRAADEHDLTLSLGDDVRATLADWCTAELDNGGRGIGMALESYFINPLARALFDADLPAGAGAHVSGIRRSGTIVTLDLT